MEAARKVMLVMVAALSGCSDNEGTPQPPTMEEIAEMVERQCRTGYACGDWGTDAEVAALIEECRTETGLWQKLTPDGNPDCDDVWIVYEFHDCWTSLGCSDYMKSPEDPSSPCHQELMAVYDAKCFW